MKNRIGPRTLYKSFQAHAVATDGSQFRRMLIDGKTKISIEKSAQIINSDYFFMGLNSQHFFPSSARCVFTMGENSRLILNGATNIAKGVIIEVHKNAVLELGRSVAINSNTSIICAEAIKIGDGAGIGWDVEICDTAFHQIGEGTKVTDPIHIGCHVLICSHSVIMKGVKIGDGSVIAAGSMVTKDIPAKCLAGGIPARVIKDSIEWS